MTAAFEPFAIALRLGGVTLDQKTLEDRLDASIIRFEPEDAESSHYAQVDITGANPVRAILDFAENSGPAIAELLAERTIGRAVLDIAFDFPENGEAMSTRLPAHMAAAVAAHDIDIEISIYLVDVEEDQED